MNFVDNAQIFYPLNFYEEIRAALLCKHAYIYMLLSILGITPPGHFEFANRFKEHSD